MKILMVHPHEVYSKNEPWTVRITSLAKELAKKGNEVKLVYFPLEFKSDTPFQKDGVEHIPYSRRGKIQTILKNCLKLAKLGRWADIIHFQKCFHYASLPSLFSGLIADKPIHYDWDDWEEMIYYDSARPPLKPVGFFIKTFEQIVPTMADTISVSGSRLHDKCLRMRIPDDRIFPLPVGVDLEKFNPVISGENIKKRYGIRQPLVLYLGQLHGGQYVEMFIRATHSLVQRGVEAAFMVVGDGVRSPDLKNLARNLGLGQKILFTGAVEYSQVPEYIAAADIAVACFEDNKITQCKSPLKIGEYMACGKAIVASEVGEIRAMLGDSGFLTKPSSTEALAQAIQALLEDHELRKTLGKRARAIAEDRFSWGLRADCLLNAYEKAVKLKKDGKS